MHLRHRVHRVRAIKFGCMTKTTSVDLMVHKGGEGGEASACKSMNETLDLLQTIFERSRDRLLHPARIASDEHLYGDYPVARGDVVIVDIKEEGLVFGQVIEATRGIHARIVLYAENLQDEHGTWSGRATFVVLSGQLMGIVTTQEAKLLRNIQDRLIGSNFTVNVTV